MATGLVIDGIEGAKVWGPLNGLGVAWSSSQIPAQYVGAIARDAQGQIGFRAMKSLCNGELIPSVGAPSSFAPSNTCGIPGSMACSYGSPEASLSGLSGLAGLGNLGEVSNFVCSDWAAIMTQMQVLLAQAEERGISTPAYAAARAYFDDSTGPFQKPIFTCASSTQKAKALYNALNTEMGYVGPTVSGTLNPATQPDAIATAVKWGAIAVAALAGAYALGPLFRGVGSLIRPRRK